MKKEYKENRRRERVQEDTMPLNSFNKQLSTTTTSTIQIKSNQEKPIEDTMPLNSFNKQLSTTTTSTIQIKSNQEKPIEETWISIDVGIKNLAFCKIKRATTSITIVDWGVISIHDSLPTEKSNDVQTFTSKTTKTKEKTKEKIKEKTNAKSKQEKPTLVDIGIQLKKWFDFLLLSEAIDGVLIENQIAPIASNMKSIQCMIAQYFIMNAIHRIVFVSSAQKLKHISTVSNTMENTNTNTAGLKSRKLSYKERKTLGISICKDALVTNPSNTHWLPFYQKHKKKDDLADAYLQAVAYFSQYELI